MNSGILKIYLKEINYKILINSEVLIQEEGITIPVSQN